MDLQSLSLPDFGTLGLAELARMQTWPADRIPIRAFLRCVGCSGMGCGGPQLCHPTSVLFVEYHRRRPAAHFTLC